MKQRIKNFLGTTSSFLMIAFSLCLICDVADAARVAVRSTPATTRRSSATAATVTTTPVAETAEIETEEEFFEDAEPIINKASQFDQFMSDAAASDSDYMSDSLAEQIRKQRALADARDNAEFVQTNQNNSLRGGKNICDAGLRECMQKECGSDFSKCALDGDTLFGDKLNRCRRQTTCSGEEFKLFTTEIKADRDMNAQLSSYTSVIDCGNKYNACIQKECGATFNKCLGKAAADRAVKTCDKIARDCAEADSGLAGRVGTVIGRLRENAEIDVKNDETRMYKLRDLMRNQCTHLGAMFDERSFDCVYTVNFFVGENQTTPAASRKLYAGDTFVCNQEWFGVNTTTFKENAYRETRAQTGASSAMLGSGVGTAVGLISSGAISRALDTQKAKKALDAAEKAAAAKQQEPTNEEECNKMDGRQWKDGKCVNDVNNTVAEQQEACEQDHGGKWNGDTCTCPKNQQWDARNMQCFYDDSGCIERGGTMSSKGKCQCGSRTLKDNETCNPEKEACEQDHGGKWNGDTCTCPKNQQWDARNMQCFYDDSGCIERGGTMSSKGKCQCGNRTLKDNEICNPDERSCYETSGKWKNNSCDCGKNRKWDANTQNCKDEDISQEVQAEVARIRKSIQNMKPGLVLSGVKMTDKTLVNNALKEWRDACRAIAQKDATIDEIDSVNTSGKMTCTVKKCAYGYSSPANNCRNKSASPIKTNKEQSSIDIGLDNETINKAMQQDQILAQNNIKASIAKMAVGEQISMNKLHEKTLKSDIDAWANACEHVQKSNHITTTAMKKDTKKSSTNITLKCIVTQCDGTWTVDKKTETKCIAPRSYS